MLLCLNCCIYTCTCTCMYGLACFFLPSSHLSSTCMYMYMYTLTDTAPAVPSVPEPPSAAAISTNTESPISGISPNQLPHPPSTNVHSGTGINPAATAVTAPNSSPASQPQNVEPKYFASNATYENIHDIPLDLLNAVAFCFQYHKIVCRACFFNSGCRVTTCKKSEKGSFCSEGHPWRPLIVMPGCRLCSNYNPSVHIPVLPIPKHMKSVTSPFLICRKTDHKTCYYMSKNTNPWFPHTVEELVIWTVERERCTCSTW